MFQVFANKGFQVTYDNGFMVSVMFGRGNYCNNRNNQYDVNRSPDAEVAVFRNEERIMIDGEWGDTGWRSPEYITELMRAVSTFSHDIPTQEARQELSRLTEV